MTLLAFTIPGVQFELPLEVIVLGLITGLTYALLGLGLALVYKTSRVINFAHGEMGALPALLIPILVTNNRWNYWPALLLALSSAMAIGALFEFGVIRRLREASRLTVLVATIGAAQVLFVIGILIPKGGELGGSTYPTPFSASVTLGNLTLGTAHILTLIVVPAIAVWLTIFFRRGRLGRASRAAAENLEAAQVAGVPVHRVSQSMWILAALLAVVSAVLVGPMRPITAQAALGPPLMVRALGAAMLGGLTNLPGVFAGGVAIGLIEALTVWNYPTAGVLEVVLFGVILVSLLAQRRLGHLARGAEGSSWRLATRLPRLDPRLAAHPRIRAARRIGLTAMLVLAATIPVPLSTSQRFFMSGVLLFAIMGLSLVVLTGFAGQISLGQFAFVGLGAAVGGRLIQLGYPHVTGIVLAIVAGAFVALIVGLPALRIRGLFLAVTTLAFAVASAQWMFNQPWLVHRSGTQTSLEIGRPVWLGIDFDHELRFYWLCLLSLIAIAALVYRIRRSRLGRSLIAVRDNELSAASLAISPRMMKLAAFVIAGVIASLAGFLYGMLLVNFSYNPRSTFGPDLSLSLVAMVIFGGVTTITGAVLGAFWVRGMPFLLGKNVGLLSSGFGLLAVLLIIPGGLVSAAFWIRDRIARALVPELPPDAEPTTTSPRALELASVLRPAIAVAAGDGHVSRADVVPIRAEDVSVWYGGNQALANVSIHAGAGEVIGLIGPNGAGKTTLFDVVSGQLRPASGRVLVDGADVTRLAPHRRARLGIGRTFQQSRLFDDLTVLECMTLAMESRERPASSGPARPARRTEESAREVVALLGLGRYLDRPASELPTGVRKTVELGCAVATGARILLLDEPAAGFSQRELEEFAPILGTIAENLGTTMIVVDHDVPLIMHVAERLYVLVAGKVIAEGPPRILEEDERVIAVYIGEGQATQRRPGRRRSRAIAGATSRRP